MGRYLGNNLTRVPGRDRVLLGLRRTGGVLGEEALYWDTLGTQTLCWDFRNGRERADSE